MNVSFRNQANWMLKSISIGCLDVQCQCVFLVFKHTVHSWCCWRRWVWFEPDWGSSPSSVMKQWYRLVCSLAMWVYTNSKPLPKLTHYPSISLCLSNLPTLQRDHGTNALLPLSSSLNHPCSLLSIAFPAHTHTHTHTLGLCGLINQRLIIKEPTLKKRVKRRWRPSQKKSQDQQLSAFIWHCSQLVLFFSMLFDVSYGLLRPKHFSKPFRNALYFETSALILFCYLWCVMRTVHKRLSIFFNKSFLKLFIFFSKAALLTRGSFSELT